MRKHIVAALIAVAAGVSACAPKIVIVPAPIVVTSPRFPDFMPPTVPADLARTKQAVNFDRGWRFLQAGDLRNADREFTLALQASPSFYPAEAGAGYLELARKDAAAALPHFDRALERQPRETSALVGRGEALLALDRETDAVASFEAAVAVNPALTDLRRRVEVLRFRGVERNLAAARQAARSGRLDEAIRDYQVAVASSPDSAFLYRELAAVERQKGDSDLALDHFRKASVLDPGDALSLGQIGELLEARGDLEHAAEAYASSLTIEPSADIETRLEAVRARLALARLPEQYRAIEVAAQITRADLAALIGVRLAAVLQTLRSRDAVLITDVRNSWAESWIMAVARAGVMDPYTTHAFQPRAAVRRTDLAQAVSRLLGRIVPPAELRAWEKARTRFPDLVATHLAYPAASVAVESGVMTTMADGGFQPSRVVSGQEAVEAIGRVEQIASRSGSRSTGER